MGQPRCDGELHLTRKCCTDDLRELLAQADRAVWEAGAEDLGIPATNDVSQQKAEEAGQKLAPRALFRRAAPTFLLIRNRQRHLGA